MLMYFSAHVSRSIINFGGIFDRDISNASNLMAYVTLEAATVICKFGI